MLQLIDQVRPVALYIANPGRLSRNASHCLPLVDTLTQARVRLRIANNPSLDPAASDQDRYMFQTFACQEDYDKRLIVSRLRRGLLSSVKAGSPLNFPPLGYVYHKLEKGAEWLKDDATKEVVQEAFQRFVTEPNLSALCRWLDTTGLKAPRSYRKVRKDEPYHWNVPTVRNLLSNTAYIGQWRYQKTERTPGYKSLPRDQRSYTARPQDEWMAVTVPVLIDPALFQQVQTLLATVGRSGADRQTHDYLFRYGRLRCGLCPEEPPMCGITDVTNGKTGYECRHVQDGQVRRAHRTQAVWKIDRLVWEQLEAYIREELPRYVTEYCNAWTPLEPTARLPQLVKQRDAKQQQIARWDDMYTHHGEDAKLSYADWAQTRAGYVQELKALEAQIAHATPPAAPRRPDPIPILAMAQQILGEGPTTLRERRRVVEALDLTAIWTPTTLTLQGAFDLGTETIALDLPPIPLPTKGLRDYSVAGTREAMAQRHPERIAQVEAFLAACCVREPGRMVLVADLYAAYTAWCAEGGHVPVHRIALGAILTTCAIGKSALSSSGGRDTRTGIVLRAAPERSTPVSYPVPRPLAPSDAYAARWARTRRTQIRDQQLCQVRAFLTACCVLEPDQALPLAVLYDAYTQWCQAQGETPRPKIGFSKLLTRCGIGRRHGWTYPAPGHKRSVDLRTGLRLGVPVGNEPHPRVVLPGSQVGDGEVPRRVQLALFAVAD
jgi:DNA invertase Pin-like site-specific DNA recombinase